MNDFKISQINHLIDLEGQKERVVIIIEELINKLNRLILEKIDPDNKSRSETLRELDVLVNSYFRDIDKETTELLKELGLYESEFYTNLINFKKEENFKEINKEENNTLIFAFLLGGTLKESLTNQRNQLKSNLQREVNVIYNNTTSNAAINNSINNIKAKLNTNNAQLKTLVRTAATNQLETAKFETLKKNNVKKYQYIAILDSQTTKICRSLHNKVFNINDKKAPRPPMHYNCRSSIVPVFDKEDEFTKEDTLKEFSKLNGNKRNIDKNGKFKLTKNDIVSLNKRRKLDKNLI